MAEWRILGEDFRSSGQRVSGLCVSQHMVDTELSFRLAFPFTHRRRTSFGQGLGFRLTY